MIIDRYSKAPRMPWDGTEEGFCPECDSYTTDYNDRGECNECGTELAEVTAAREAEEL